MDVVEIVDVVRSLPNSREALGSSCQAELIESTLP